MRDLPLKVQGTMCALGLLFTMVYARDCHVSTGFDNVNPFSEGFMVAGEVQEVVDRHIRKSWDGTTVERCIANTHIRDAYRRLPYATSKVEQYDEEVRQWCGHLDAAGRWTL